MITTIGMPITLTIPTKLRININSIFANFVANRAANKIVDVSHG